MSATVLYMSMSLDGFIAGPNERPDNGLGDGGHRLHEWIPMDGDPDPKEIAGRIGGANGQIVDEFMSTGAVVAGRGTFEPAGGWGGDHHDGVPIFILSRGEPGIDIGGWPLVTYVDDVSYRDVRGQARRRRTGTCSSTAPGPRSSRSPRASSTSSRSVSSRCSSARAGASSTTSLPSTSSWSARASSRARAA